MKEVEDVIPGCKIIKDDANAIFYCFYYSIACITRS